MAAESRWSVTVSAPLLWSEPATSGTMEWESSSAVVRESPYNRFLPYANELEIGADRFLQMIKDKLRACVLSPELGPGFGHDMELIKWVNKVFHYVCLHGYRFTKEDHLLFVRTSFEVRNPVSETTL